MGLKIGNLETYGIIYKIENLVNGKVYIGQTTSSFDKRYGNNLENNTHNEHLKRSIKKYGIENFDISKEFDIAFSKDELDIKEQLWIRYYNSCDIKYGYNKSYGGSNGKHTKDTKQLLSELAKNSHKWQGENNPKYNNGDFGENNSQYGVSPKERMSEETYINWKNKISINTSGSSNPNSSKVICLETGQVYDCIKYALKEYGNIAISANCRGKCKSAGKLKDGTKLHWKYYKDYINRERVIND